MQMKSMQRSIRMFTRTATHGTTRTMGERMRVQENKCIEQLV